VGKPSFPRTRRLNAIILEVLAEEVELLTDPRIGLISITGVQVSPDMRHAVVFFSALDRSRLDEALKGLTAAAPRLRGSLGRQIRIKYTPELEFRVDQGVVEGERIDAILRDLSHDDEPGLGEPDE
jgi:ribosome-binding factor A